MALMPIHKEIIRFVLTVTVAATAGGYFAYQKMMTTPIPAQYAVVDIAGYIKKNLQREIDPNKASGQVAIQEEAKKLTEYFKEMTDSGIVILDASQVISAPENAFIDLSLALAKKPIIESETKANAEEK